MRPAPPRLLVQLTCLLLAAPGAAAQRADLQLIRRIPLADVMAGRDGQPISVAVSTTGLIAVAQRSPVSVTVFDTTGRLLRTVGREGAGPGEFLYPFVAFHRDTLVIGDGKQRRIVLYDARSGRLLTQYVIDASAVGATVDAEGRVYQLSTRSTFLRGGTGISLLRYRLDGRFIDTVTAEAPNAPATLPKQYWEVRNPAGGGVQSAIPFGYRLQYAVDPRGGILTAWSGGPTIAATAKTRVTTVRAKLATTPAAIPAATRRAARDSALRVDAKSVPMDVLERTYDLADIPSVYPFMSRIEVDGTGRLWLAQPSAPAGRAQFLVVDAKGAATTVTLPADQLGKARGWGGYFMATLVEEEEGAVLVIYRVR